MLAWLFVVGILITLEAHPFHFSSTMDFSISSTFDDDLLFLTTDDSVDVPDTPITSDNDDSTDSTDSLEFDFSSTQSQVESTSTMVSSTEEFDNTDKANRIYFVIAAFFIYGVLVVFI